eukprot:XP_017948830.1 PREDICTED: uncharacterized protein LOC108647386 isoform X1 [Xenopus tropicalis]
MLTAVLLSSVGGPNDVSAPCDSPVPSTRSDTLGSPAPNYCFPFRADNAPFADWSVLVTCPVGTEHVTECRALIGSRRVKVMRGENMAAESLKRRFRPCSSGFGLRLPTRYRRGSQGPGVRGQGYPYRQNAFFHQHSAPTSDTNAKYNSRSAQM